MFDVEREREREEIKRELLQRKRKRPRVISKLCEPSLCIYNIQNNQISRARAHTHTPVDGLYTY
jgi:hypothetical protein